MTKSTTIQAWYLCNLLVLPLISFAVIAWHYWRWVRPHQGHIADEVDFSFNDKLTPMQQRQQEQALGQAALDLAHIRSAFWLSLAAGGALLAGVLVMYYLINNLGLTLPLALIYFILVHTGFVIWGMLNLTRAMADRLPLFKIL